MHRLPWGSQSVTSALECFVLVPESDPDIVELKESLDAAGVRDSMAFNKSGINGRLDFPAEIIWDDDGAVELKVIVQGSASPISTWFWLVECDDESGRRYAWWSTQRDARHAKSWS